MKCSIVKRPMMTAMAGLLLVGLSDPAISQDVVNEIRSPAPGAYQTAPGSLTIDDLLQLEDFGAAAVAPDGSRAAYEHVLSTATNRGSFYGAYNFDDRVIRIVEPASGRTTTVVGEPGDHFNLVRLGQPFSPDGRYLALRAVRSDRTGIAVWDSRKRDVRWLPGGGTTHAMPTGWTADNRLIYATASETGGDVSSVTIASRLVDRWRKTAQGVSPQVTVFSNHPSVKSSSREEGFLMLAGADGAATTLARGDYTEISVAPDGKRFAVVRRAEPTSGPSVDGRRGELQVFTLTASGAQMEARFTEQSIALFSLRWSPNSTALLATGRLVAEGAAAPARIFQYDTASSELQAVPTGKLLFNDVRGGSFLRVLPSGWIGDTPVVIGALPAGQGSASAENAAGQSIQDSLDYGRAATQRLDLWALEPTGARKLTAFAQSDVHSAATPHGYDDAFVVTDGALWRVPLDGQPERLTPRTGPMVAAFAPSAETALSAAGTTSPLVSLTIVKEGRPVQAMFDLASRSFTPRAPGARLVAASSDFGIQLIEQAVDRATSMQLRRRQGAASEIQQINAFLNEKTEGKLIRVPYRVGDRDLTAWVLLPPNGQAGEPLPAVVVAYGGVVFGAEPPAFADIDQRFHLANGQLLAAQGYAVVYPSFPLRSGAESNLPDQLAQSAETAVDAAADLKLIDRERAAVMGQSFGGYSTAAILSASDHFKTGIATSGIYSFPTIYGSRELAGTLQDNTDFWPASMLYVEGGQTAFGAPPWVTPEPYVRNSPLFRADRINAPLMIMQGDLDLSLTSIYGAEQMYAALVHAGKQAVLVRYWGEGHGNLSEPNIRDQWQRIQNWLNTHLGNTDDSLGTRTPLRP